MNDDPCRYLPLLGGVLVDGAAVVGGTVNASVVVGGTIVIVVVVVVEDAGEDINQIEYKMLVTPLALLQSKGPSQLY